MNIKTTSCSVWIFSLFLSLQLIAQKPAAQRMLLKESILENFYRIDDGVYRSGQPTADNFRDLERFGIREVLNLRNWHDDQKEALNCSVQLHHLKTRASKIDENDIIKALTIIKNRKGPILFHCWHGSDRTGAVAAMYRIIFQGWSKYDAIHEMTEGGFGFHNQFRQIIDMINRADIEAIKLSIKG